MISSFIGWAAAAQNVAQGPILSVSTSSLSITPVVLNASSTSTLTITNVGTEPLTISSLNLFSSVADANVSLLLNMNGSNGSTTFTDATNLNTVTAVGGAQISTTQSKFGGASAYFDGSGDYLSIPTNARFDFGSNDFTIECWFYAPSSVLSDNIYRPIIAIGNASNAITITKNRSGRYNNLYAGYYANNTWQIHLDPTNTVIPTDAWTHVALVRSNNTFTLYVNGVSISTGTYSGSMVLPTYTVAVGHGFFSGEFWNGYIDDLRITKGFARYTSNFTPPTEQHSIASTDFTASGCTTSVAPGATCPLTITFAPTTTTGAKSATLSIAHNGTNSPTTVAVSSSVIEADNDFYRTVLLTHMDGTDGSTTIVDSTNKNTFTISGNAQIRTADSKFGGASAYFPGNGSYIAVAPNNDFAFGTGDFTIECWFKPGTLNKNHGIFSLTAGPSHLATTQISVNANSATNQLNYYLGPAGSGGNQTGQTVLDTSTWYHLALVRNSGVIRIYLNGVAEPIFSGASTTLSNTTNFTYTYLSIGGYYGTSYTWLGYIDDFRVTKGLARYTSNFSVPSAPFSDAQGGVSLISTSATALSVAATRLGQTTTSTITVTNTGVTPLTVANLTISGANAADFSVSGCTSAVAANASCALTVSFTPSTIGSKSANLTINSNAYNSALVTVPITSTAVNPAITLSSNAITLSNIVPGETATSNLTVTSSGTTALTISNVTLQGTDAADFTVTNGCLSSIAANSNCSIGITFDPVGTGDKYLTNTSLLMNMNGTNGSTTFTDATGKNTSFTVYGNTQISTAQSKFGGASAYFDGTGDYITLPSNSEFSFGTGDFTIECWARLTAGTNNGIVCLSSLAGYFGGTGTITLTAYYGKIAGYIGSTGFGGVTQQTSMNYNQWYHFALVRSSGVIKLYQDGIAQPVFSNGASTTLANTTNYTYTNLLIGGYNSTNQLWNGYIDDLRITKGVARYTGNFTPPAAEFATGAFSTTYGTRTANLVITHDAISSPSIIPITSNVVVAAPAISLSTSDLTIASANIGSSTSGTITVTNTGTTPLTISQLSAQSGDQYWDNVTALLSMDGSNGATTFTDSSSFARTMTATGNVQISTANSKFGGASALFSGNGQIGSASSTDFAFGSGDFTIEFWTKFNTNTPLQRLIYFSDDRDNIDMGSDGTTMTYWDGSSTAIASGINTTNWNHVAVSRSGGTLYFFWNGTLVTSRGSAHSSSTRSLHIGGTAAGTQPFNGYIDDLRITKGVGRYTTSFTPPAAQYPAFVTTAQVEFSASGCSSAVPAGGSCALTVTFTPTISGVQRNRLLITHNASGSPSVVNLTSTGVAVPLFSAASSTIRVATDSASTTTSNLVITNTGTSALTISNLSITGANIADFSVSGCSSSIPASGTCTLTTTFAPSTVGNKTANLVITHSASGSPSTINLIGDSTEPDFYFNNNGLLLHADGTNGSTTFIDITGKNTFTRLGNVQISTAQSKFGGASAYFDGTSSALYTPHKADIDFGAGDFTIECWVRFNQLSGSKNTVLTKGWGAPATSTGAFLIWADNTSLVFYATSSAGSWDIANRQSFGTVTTNTWYHVAVTRQGSTFRCFLNGAVTATFTATSALLSNATNDLYIGARSDNLVNLDGYIDEVRLTKGLARYTAAFTPSTVPFSNAAAAVPVITTSTSNLSIASTNTGSTNTGTITITNTGTVPLTVSNLSISGANAADFTVSGCSTAIAADSSCTLTVTFAPSAVGSKSATLTISSNAYNAATTTVTLSSTAVAPAISLSANTLAIASTTAGYTNTGTITVTNTGTAPLTVSSLSLLSADANVSLLLNMNGSNGSTTFTDATNLNTVTAVGGAQISTTQSKFGGASAYFDGSGDYLSMPADARFAFGTGDFTVECWVRPTIADTWRGIFSSGANFSNQLTIRLMNTNKLQVYFHNGTFDTMSTTSVLADVWTHIAVTRSSNNLYMFINGVLTSTTGSSVTNWNPSITSSETAYVGNDRGYVFQGYIDDLRVTKGVARYTENFTPTTEQLTSGIASTDFTVSGCSTPIAAGGTCPLTVTFAPSTVGSKAATLYISHNATGSPSTVSVSSTALAPAPAISLSSSTLTIANTNVGSSSTSNITVSNTGTAPLTVSSLSFSGTNASDFTVSGCSGNVAVGGNCVVSVTFTPSTGGSKSATLSIAHNATGSPSNVSVSSTALAPAVSLSASTLSIASTTTGYTNTGTITVTNTGTAPLTVSNLTVTGTDAADFSVSGCSSAVAAGNTCTLTVTFAPSTSGSKSAALSITHNAAGSPSTVSLSSTALAAVPVFSVSSNTLSLTAAPNGSTTGNLTITNTGTAPLTVTNLSITGTDAVDFSVTGCSSAVAAGASCVLTVTFAPAATSGSKAATLSITHNASGSPNTVTLNGSIEQPDIYFNSTSLLLHADGTNGSTTFTDSTSKNTLTVIGNAQISTAQSKFGGASAYFDGAGDGIYTAHKADIDFGAGDFTIECWVRFNQLSGSKNTVITKGWGTPTTNTGAFLIWADNTSLVFYATSSAGGWDIANRQSFGTVTTNTWYHIAVTRQGSTFRCFLNGALSATFTSTLALLSNSANDLYIGNRNDNGVPLDGYIDEVRLTKGVARYSSNFNAPTAAFPNVSGTAADIRVDTTSVSITATDVGSIRTATITVTNAATATANLAISSLVISGTNSADFTVTGCSGSVAIGGSCTLTVTFSPTATTAEFENRTATLVISSNAYNGPVTIQLSSIAARAFDPYFGETSLLMHMDGTNGSVDFIDATGKNTPTIIGQTQVLTAESKFGGTSAYFDGTGDYITIPNNPNAFAFGTGDYTIECWFKSTIASPSASKGIVQLSSNSGYFTSGTTSISLSLYQGTIYFGYGNSSNSRSKLINDTNWHHAAMVRASGVSSLYIDGELVTTGSGSTTDTTNYAHSFLLIAGYGASNQTWSGYIDELRVTKGFARYTTNFTPQLAAFRNVESTANLDPYYNNVGLLAHMDGSNGSTAFLDATGRNSLTAVGSAQISTAESKFGGASAYFNGSNSYITAPTNVSGLAFGTGDFTIECWFKTNNISGNTGLFQLSGLSSYFIAATSSICFYINNGTMYAQFGSSGTVTTTIGDNNWHHMAISRNNNVGALFIDGQLIGTRADSINYASQSYLVIGGYLSTSNLWNGYIDDFRVTKGVSRYRTTFAVPTLEYPNSGLITAPLPSTTSVYFDGTGDYLNVSANSNLALGTGDFTIEAWVFLLKTGSDRNIYNQYINLSGSFLTGQLRLYVNSTGTLIVNLATASSTQTPLTSSVTVPTNVWTHVSLTRASGTARLFINGRVVATDSTNWTTRQVGLSDQPVRIGSESTSVNNIWNGYIADLRVSKGVAHYTAAFNPPMAALTTDANTALMLRATSSTITDATGNSTITAVGDAKPTPQIPGQS